MCGAASSVIDPVELYQAAKPGSRRDRESV